MLDDFKPLIVNVLVYMVNNPFPLYLVFTILNRLNMEKKFIVSFELTGVEIEILNSLLAHRVATLEVKLNKFRIIENKCPWTDWLAEYRALEALMVRFNNSAKEVKNESSNQVK